MTIDEAMKEAKAQISQSDYLTEYCDRVCKTGLRTVYENKAKLLHALLRCIEELKANQPAKCCECIYRKFICENVYICEQSELSNPVVEENHYCSYAIRKVVSNENR